MKLTTRHKAIISSIILGIAFFLFPYVDFVQIGNLSREIISSMFLGFLCMMAIYWIEEFDISGQRFITVLAFPGFSVFIISLFLELAGIHQERRISVFTISVLVNIFFAVCCYALLLAMNLLNVASQKMIPLGQVARAFLYIFTLIIAYFSYSLTFGTDWTPWAKASALFGFNVILVYENIWGTELSLKDLMVWSVGIALTVSGVGSVFFFWPAPIELISLFLAVVLYLLLGFALNIRRTFSWLMWGESLVLLLLSSILVFSYTDWGI